MDVLWAKEAAVLDTAHLGNTLGSRRKLPAMACPPIRVIVSISCRRWPQRNLTGNAVYRLLLRRPVLQNRDNCSACRYVGWVQY